MKRTGEVVLGVIGVVFNVLAIIATLLLVIGSAGFTASPDYAFFEQTILEDPTLSAEEAIFMADFVRVFFDVISVFGWVIIIGFVISSVLAIIGVVKIAKNGNPKLAGTMFIIAGVLSGILSLTSILFYIAAIMSFVRKAPQEDFYINNNDHDQPYQPL